ncbi:beta-mannosidase [Confluentibacter flavum]|uniref:Beta-mannosidase B n=1 Tax=Confluentibacter flavum TaxID=1909700 RepID=A0A2N3HG40_9FLAO|nr:glycoside hydrolase family 2 protein [Confluentibacter flavum]PKQ43949.1 beta-mannosidase [Confluentibacter flavum]
MHKFIHYGLLSFLIITSIMSCKVSSVSEIRLNENWSFKNSKDTLWSQASVPGTVHTDLLYLEKIEDPYYRLNEHELQWIDKTDWHYQTTFNLSKEAISKQHIELDFSGLDTYSKVYLNFSLLLETDNMFRHYSVDAKQLLKVGDNVLQIHFESPINKGVEKHDALGYKLPLSDNDLAKIGQVHGEKHVSPFTRKAGYHFGWDWGPRLVTSGIWRPITLRSWNHLKIEDVFIQQNSISEKANMTAFIEVDATGKSDKAKAEIFVNGESIKTANLDLTNGKNNLSIPFEIENPQLWWPNGMGEQYLYVVEVKLTSNEYVDSKSHKIGLRTIELIREPDTFGTSFYFKVNGHPVFMKGANYIPQDVFLPRVKKENYGHIVSSAKAANMNMLRVWGGGIYENDEFYELCDEMGLLVWQDFMFACSMYPDDSKFLENVKQEAIDNVKRLRNHTSIALWCGNNEALIAWESWGWKDKITREQSKDVANTIWKAYDTIFHKILPKVVVNYDPTRPYWPSSPGSDFGGKESHDKGDAHYWMVWWGKEPFEKYNTAIPRFMSEYGFQSFPELATVEKYTLPQDHNIYSDVMKSHQRSSIGNETIEDYMLRYYKSPKDFASFLYVSQLLQAYGVQVGIEAHRRNRDRCMGSLYWQINDCWPVASWSSIDYHGKWKALHYTAKQSFENFLISFEDKGEHIDVFVVSDSLKPINATLKITAIDFDGNILKQQETPIEVKENQSKKYISLLKNGFLTAIDSTKVLLKAELLNTADNKTITENILYLSAFKNLKLPAPELTYAVTETNDHFIVTLKTKKLAKNVFLASGSSNNFSDNYFDMLPNTEKTISIKKTKLETLESFTAKLNVITLVDTYDNSEISLLKQFTNMFKMTFGSR